MITVYQYKLYDTKFDCYQISEEYATQGYIETLQNAVVLVETAKEVEDNDVDDGRCISVKIDYKSSVDILTRNLKERENNLNEVLLAEYIKRKTFVSEALHDYLENIANSKKVQRNISDYQVRLSKIKSNFLIASVAVIILSVTPIGNVVSLAIAYLFSIAYYSSEYANILNTCVTQSGSLNLSEFEAQRLRRELAMYGIDIGDLIRWEMMQNVLTENSIEGKVNEMDIIRTEQQLLRMYHRVLQNLKRIK